MITRKMINNSTPPTKGTFLIVSMPISAYTTLCEARAVLSDLHFASAANFGVCAKNIFGGDETPDTCELRVVCSIKSWDKNRQFWQGLAHGFLYARKDLD